jgi:hypothetical protein
MVLPDLLRAESLQRWFLSSDTLLHFCVYTCQIYTCCSSRLVFSRKIDFILRFSVKQLNLYARKNCESASVPSVSVLRRTIFFCLKVPGLRIVCLFANSNTQMWSNGGKRVTGENPSTRTETCPSDTSSNKNTTLTGLWSNPGLYNDRLMTKVLRFSRNGVIGSVFAFVWCVA